MNSLLTQVKDSPVPLRVVPFVIFLALTFCQGLFGEAGRYWLYLIKTLLGAWMIWAVYPFIPEMRWKLSGEAILIGVVVFGLWVGLPGFLKSVGLNPSFAEFKVSARPWNPFSQFGEHSIFAWFFVGVRLAGSAVVVPMLEEVFFRSLLYRYIINSNFLSVPLGQFFWKPFLITSIIFGLEHREWLAGILCGFAYQGLVCWKKRLGDALTAHAITNLLLGLWVVWKNAWNFW